MKKFTLLILVMLLGITGVNAKSRTTPTELWKETYNGGNIEISVDKLVSGATITVSTTVASSNASDDRKLHIFYTAGNGWTQTSFADISDWVELTAGQESYSFTLTSSAYDILSDDTKSHKILYIGANNKDYVTISKITMIAPTGETELFNGSWPGSWTQKNFDAQSNAKIGDVIRLSYTCTSGDYVQINFLDNSGNNTFTGTTTLGTNIYATSGVFDYEITCYDDMVKVQTGGFAIKGVKFTLTSVKLLTYADSYDAVSITVGSDGIATYSNTNKNVQISACDALKAYYASAVAEGTVTLTELTGCIPANTGVMIYGAEDTYTVPVGTEGWPSITTNYLKPTGDYSATVAASTDGTYHYIFAKKGNETPAFYKLTADHNLAAHKAYLETTEDIKPNSPEAPLRFYFSNGTTAIMDVFQDEMKQQPVQEDNVYYTLQGTRVQNPTKGLYILNGKKIIVK